MLSTLLEGTRWQPSQISLLKNKNIKIIKALFIAFHLTALQIGFFFWLHVDHFTIKYLHFPLLCFFSLILGNSKTISNGNSLRRDKTNIEFSSHHVLNNQKCQTFFLDILNDCLIYQKKMEINWKCLEEKEAFLWLKLLVEKVYRRKQKRRKNIGSVGRKILENFSLFFALRRKNLENFAQSRKMILVFKQRRCAFLQSGGKNC